MGIGKNEGFDRVFDLVGGNGRFQYRLLLITSLQLIILTWHHIGYTFFGAVPDHWCLTEELTETNWTVDEIKLLSIPRILKGEEYEFDKCNQYYFNYGSLASTSASFEEAYSKIDYSNASTIQCKRWDYDRTIYKATIPTEFDLVCGRRWMTATIQSSYMAGGLIGTVLLGSVSDRFLGRRKTVLISLSVVVVAGIAASFAKSYWIFLFFRFFISIGVSGSMQNCFGLIMEHADMKGRALLGIFEQIPFAVGYMILPAYAYFFRDWSQLQLAFGITSLAVIVYKWILPHSPRWLATHGKEDLAVQCLLKIAKTNKRLPPSRDALLAIIRPCYEFHKTATAAEENLASVLQHHEPNPYAEHQSEGGQASAAETEPKKEHKEFLTLFKQRLAGVARNYKSLIETAEIRRRSLVFWTMFLTVSMVYYGIVFSTNLTSDPFLMVFLSGLMEIPAYTLIVPFVSKLGRRPTTSATFILTGICMITLSQVPNKYDTLRIVLAMSAKLFISSAFAIIYLLGAELYPTEMRMTGLAVGVFMGRVGAITAPFIADLMQLITKDLPSLIFGVSACVAGIVALALPETKRLEMTDQVYEVEKQAEDEKSKENKTSWLDAI